MYILMKYLIFKVDLRRKILTLIYDFGRLNQIKTSHLDNNVLYLITRDMNQNHSIVILDITQNAQHEVKLIYSKDKYVLK
jgi:DNA-directed RNA polymerase subunit F